MSRARVSLSPKALCDSSTYGECDIRPCSAMQGRIHCRGLHVRTYRVQTPRVADASGSRVVDGPSWRVLDEERRARGRPMGRAVPGTTRTNEEAPSCLSEPAN